MPTTIEDTREHELVRLERAMAISASAVVLDPVEEPLAAPASEVLRWHRENAYLG